MGACSKPSESGAAVEGAILFTGEAIGKDV
jgi:hypothetical protein